MVAALGGVYLGLSIVGGGDTSLALYHWSLLFVKLVVPMQIIAAIFEGLLLRQIHFVETSIPGRMAYPIKEGGS